MDLQVGPKLASRRSALLPRYTVHVTMKEDYILLFETTRGEKTRTESLLRSTKSVLAEGLVRLSQQRPLRAAA